MFACQYDTHPWNIGIYYGFPFHEILAFRGIREMSPFCNFNSNNDIGTLPKRPHMQPSQKPGDGVALVPGQAETIADLLYCDPPLLPALLLHELLQQFRYPMISVHGSFLSIFRPALSSVAEP